jgi:hypothetical protein
MASAMIYHDDDPDTEDDGRSLAAATTASFSLVPAATSMDASMAEWTHIGEATVATATTHQSGWEPFLVTNDDESENLVWTDHGMMFNTRKSPAGSIKNSNKRMGARWGIDDDEELPSSDLTLAGIDYNIKDLKGSVQSKNKRERRSSPLILRRFNSDNSDDINTNNEGNDESDNGNQDDETTYTRKSWMPQWHDVEQQSTVNEVSKRKGCPSSCQLSFTCHVVIVLIVILLVFLVLLLFFLFQQEIIAWP